MDNTLYSALAAQTALQKQLEVTANNMANSSTTGFKRERLYFEAEFSKLRTAGSGVSFVQDISSTSDFTAGNVTRTGNDLDVALDGTAMLGINSGGNSTLYTRDGRMSISKDGILVQTTTGSPVLDAGGASIAIPRTARRIVIGQDGTITADEQTVGRLGLFEISPEAMRRLDNGLFSTGAGTARTATNQRVRQGFVEGSNVNSVLEMTNLINVQRAYERASNLSRAEIDRTSRAIQVLGRTSSSSNGS